MSLLDDVSIVVTPNAYKASKLYAVLPTNVEGSELVTDGDFPTGSSAWNFGAGWSIANNKAVVDNASTTALTQSGLAVIIGKKYNVSFEISDYVSGGFQFQFGASQVLGSVDDDGVYNFSAISTVNTTVLYLYATGDCEFKVGNVTCKQDTGADMSVTRATAATRVDENGLVNYAEVLGSELVTCGDFSCANPNAAWTVGSGWNIANGKATASPAADYLSQANVYDHTTVKTYKITYDITVDSGTFKFLILGKTGSSFFGDKTTSGTYTAYFTTTGSSGDGRLFIAHQGNFDGDVNSVSVKESDKNNVPRIDYTGGGCPHILAEPQRTNIVTYSEDFSNSYWTKSGASVTSGIVSPNGTANAYKLVEDSANSRHFISSAEFTTSGTVYSSSVFVKASGRSKIALRENAQTGKYASFNLSNGTLIQTNGVSASIELISNGWYRINYQITSGNSIILGIELLPDSYTSGDPYANPYQGNGSSGVEIYGVQVELGSYATSYIPTSGSAVTRNKDIFIRDGIASLINSTEGVLFLEVAAFITTSPAVFITLNNGGGNNKVAFYYSSVLNQIIFECVVGGATQASFTYTSSNITNFDKVAFSWKLNQFKLFANGSQVGSTDTSGSVNSAGTLNKLSFDYGSSGVHDFEGKVKQLQVYKTALTDNQLIQLTGEAGTHFFESYAEMASALTYTIQ